jgi:hypothetical protein
MELHTHQDDTSLFRNRITQPFIINLAWSDWQVVSGSHIPCGREELGRAVVRVPVSMEVGICQVSACSDTVLQSVVFMDPWSFPLPIMTVLLAIRTRRNFIADLIRIPNDSDLL